MNAFAAYKVAREVLDNYLSHTYHTSYAYGPANDERYYYQGLKKVFEVDSTTDWHGKTIWWLMIEKPPTRGVPSIRFVTWIDYDTRVEIQCAPDELPRRIIEEVRSLIARAGHYEDPYTFGNVE